MPAAGTLHPLSQTIAEFKEIMGRFGFGVAEGPEIEDERHNFDAAEHSRRSSRRDPLDNFYLAVAQKQNAALQSGGRCCCGVRRRRCRSG
ncbi:MAG: hypothetical protein U0903_08430 [Planctomycetales bacterium]